MEKLLAQLYLPAGTAYQNNSTIRRTVLPRRPVRRVGPLPLFADVQALPPLGWCPGCAMELYRQGQMLCPDCAGEDSG